MGKRINGFAECPIKLTVVRKTQPITSTTHVYLLRWAHGKQQPVQCAPVSVVSPASAGSSEPRPAPRLASLLTPASIIPY